MAQVKQHIPEQPVERTASTDQILKKGIKLILKTIGNRKGDCAWCCSRWQTQPEKICKLQSTNQYNLRSEWHWFVRCDLQIFSGCVCHLEQHHAQSPFLFPIFFSINYFSQGVPCSSVPNSNCVCPHGQAGATGCQPSMAASSRMKRFSNSLSTMRRLSRAQRWSRKIRPLMVRQCTFYHGIW